MVLKLRELQLKNFVISSVCKHTGLRTRKRSGTQQRPDEDIVDVPVPQVMEAIVQLIHTGFVLDSGELRIASLVLRPLVMFPTEKVVSLF